MVCQDKPAHGLSWVIHLPWLGMLFEQKRLMAVLCRIACTRLTQGLQLSHPR